MDMSIEIGDTARWRSIISNRWYYFKANRVHVSPHNNMFIHQAELVCKANQYDSPEEQLIHVDTLNNLS